MAEMLPGSVRWTWRLVSAGVAVFVLGPLLAHFGIVRPYIGFLLFALGGFLGIIALVLGVVAVFRAGGESRASALRALVPALVIAAVFLVIAVPAGKYPPINDISTDTQHPPEFVAANQIAANRGRDMSYAGEAMAQQQRSGYPRLHPLVLPQAADAAFGQVETVARGMPGWKITRDDQQNRTLEGTETTRVFRFVDDFVITVIPAEQGSVVQMRSKSRDGKGDIGANAARIERFFAKLRPGADSSEE